LVQLPPRSAAITQFAPYTFYAGDYPTALLSETSHAGFNISAVVDLLVVDVNGNGLTGTVLVAGSWPGAVAVSKEVTLSHGTSTVKLELDAGQTQRARLWQPNGHGNQTLYTITASFTCAAAASELSGAAAPSVTSRTIGFRHVVLVTTNDTDATARKAASEQNGSGQLGLFFRVNGAPMFARGGNKIPMELLDGRMTAEGHRRLVQSAAEGNFNMLRIWGGAIWEPRAFYDACDEFGILLYHDLQLGGKHLDYNWNIIPAEVEYQVKRNAHHPSIAIWDGCNECHETSGLAPTQDNFTKIALTTVAKVDRSRPIWPSSPASGWDSGVDGLTTRPNGELLIMGVGAKPTRQSGFPFLLEAHGPYSGFMRWSYYRGHSDYISDAVMGVAARGPVEEGCLGLCGLHSNSLNGRNPATECQGVCSPYVVPAWTGAGHAGTFTSEFGCNAWSSFESISATLPPDQWGMSTPASALRNWNVSNVIGTYFGLDAVTAGMQHKGERAFKTQLYQSLIGQLLFMKVQIESFRSQNMWGALFWMFNEIW
jgi:hypothetical protein